MLGVCVCVNSKVLNREIVSGRWKCVGLKPKVMSEEYVPTTTGVQTPRRYQSHVNMKASMPESHALPEKYAKMSLGELHEEIRHMEELVRLLKEKVGESGPRMPCSETVDVNVRSTQETTPQALSCWTKVMALEEPGCPRSLKAQEYKRYGRQMIMPEVGLSGMLKLS